MKKTALTLSLILAFMPISQLPLNQPLVAEASSMANSKDTSINLNGVTYHYTGYAAIRANLYPESDGVITDKNTNWFRNARYNVGADPNTLLVEADTFVGIFANDKYPKDKIPAEVYHAVYRVESIDNKGKANLSYHSAANDSVGEMFKKSKFIAEFPNYTEGYLKKGDLVKIWHMFPTNGNLELYIPDIYKYENLGQPSSKELLAKSTFDTLIQVEAARILLEQSPITAARIAPKLRKSIEESEKLINKSFTALVGKENLSEKEKEEAIVEIIRLYYGKEVNTEKQKQLALSIYNTNINVNAGKTLLFETPNTVRKINNQLSDLIYKSESLLNKSLRLLK